MGYQRELDLQRVQLAKDVKDIITACRVDLDSIAEEYMCKNEELLYWEYSKSKVKRLRIAINQRLMKIEKEWR